MENKQHSEQDALAQVFRDKLAHHSMPVDSSAWDAIQSRLKGAGAAGAAGEQQAGGIANGESHQPKAIPVAGASSGKRRKAVMWWISLSAAASLALLLTLGWLYQQQQKPAEVLLSEVVQEENETTTESAQAKPAEPLQARASVVKPMPKKNNITASVLPGNNARILKSSSASSLDDVTPTNEPATVSVPEAEVEPSTADNIKEVENSQQTASGSKLKELVPVAGANEDWTNQLPVKKGRPMLAAAMGSGFSAGSGSSRGLYMDAMSESFLSNSSRPMRAKELSPADFDKKEYLPPLSAGVKLRFASNGKWAFETGLQYTYLHTKLSNELWTGHSAEMKLHYIGIPLGVALTLTDSPRWQLYLSGGVLVEKGVQSVYDEYRDWGTAVFNTHVSKGIEGMQWSMFTAVGAGYHIDKNTMLYFEPQLSYFFDNDQPLSVRTEQPLMLGLTAGIRFSF